LIVRGHNGKNENGDQGEYLKNQIENRSNDDQDSIMSNEDQWDKCI